MRRAHGGLDSLCGVAGPRRQRRRLLLRDRPGWLQGRPCPLPREHAASQAVWFQGHARGLLGGRGVLHQPPGGDEQDGASDRSGRPGRAHCRQALAEEPARGIHRGDRRDCGGAIVEPSDARRGAARRRAAGSAVAGTARRGPARSQSAHARGAGRLRSCGCRDVRDRAHVHSEARRIGSTPIRSFWPLAPAICWRGSAAGFR